MLHSKNKLTCTILMTCHGKLKAIIHWVPTRLLSLRMELLLY